MPGARRSRSQAEDPVRPPSGARRGPAASGTGKEARAAKRSAARASILEPATPARVRPPATVAALGAASGRIEVAPWHRERLDPDFTEEHVLWSRGYRYVAGLDEVGRGCLAGPVTSAAVILPPDWKPRGLRDSKLLKPEERRRLDEEIRANAIAWAIAFVEPAVIDRINILQATLLATELAAARLPIRPDALILDAVTLPDVAIHQHVLVSADRLCASVAAASVIAKVARDRLMEQLDEVYPGYDLARNKGYAAPEHRAGLTALGLSPIHRLSFAPCRNREQMSLWDDPAGEAEGEATEADEDLVAVEIGD